MGTGKEAPRHLTCREGEGHAPPSSTHPPPDSLDVLGPPMLLAPRLVPRPAGRFGRWGERDKRAEPGQSGPDQDRSGRDADRSERTSRPGRPAATQPAGRPGRRGRKSRQYVVGQMNVRYERKGHPETPTCESPVAGGECGRPGVALFINVTTSKDGDATVIREGVGWLCALHKAMVQVAPITLLPGQSEMRLIVPTNREEDP